MYCFTNWISEINGFGKEPNLPEGVSYLKAWSLGKENSKWCLCEIRFDENFDEDSVNIAHVCSELKILLESAKSSSFCNFIS